jgi:hypothetical protein
MTNRSIGACVGGPELTRNFTLLNGSVCFDGGGFGVVKPISVAHAALGPSTIPHPLLKYAISAFPGSW